MLAADHRLRKSRDISAALKSGQRCASKHLVLHVQAHVSQETKFAFAVGKNVGNSVVRHRLTRQLRHISVQFLGDFPQGSHVVVRALPSARQAQFSALTESFAAAVRKSKTQ